MSAQATVIVESPAVTMFDIVDETKRLFSGWASVEVLDMQNDIVPVSEMKKAMLNLMDRGASIIFGHQNKPVGKVLQWEIAQHPITKTLGVHLIAKLFSDYEVDNVVWDKVKQGILKGFSIGATAHSEKKLVKDASKPNVPKEVGVLHNLSLLEVSLVEKPANQFALLDQVNYYAKGEVTGDTIEGKPELSKKGAKARDAQNKFEFGAVGHPTKGNTELIAAIESMKAVVAPYKSEPLSDSVKGILQDYDIVEKKHVGFKRLQSKLEGKGHSEESAAKIAAAIGRKKYGKKGMAAKARGARKGTVSKSPPINEWVAKVMEGVHVPTEPSVADLVKEIVTASGVTGENSAFLFHKAKVGSLGRKVETGADGPRTSIEDKDAGSPTGGSVGHSLGVAFSRGAKGAGGGKGDKASIDHGATKSGWTAPGGPTGGSLWWGSATPSLDNTLGGGAGTVPFGNAKSAQENANQAGLPSGSMQYVPKSAESPQSKSASERTEAHRAAHESQTNRKFDWSEEKVVVPATFRASDDTTHGKPGQVRIVPRWDAERDKAMQVGARAGTASLPSKRVRYRQQDYAARQTGVGKEEVDKSHRTAHLSPRTVVYRAHDMMHRRLSPKYRQSKGVWRKSIDAALDLVYKATPMPSGEGATEWTPVLGRARSQGPNLGTAAISQPDNQMGVAGVDEGNVPYDLKYRDDRDGPDSEDAEGKIGRGKKEVEGNESGGSRTFGKALADIKKATDDVQFRFERTPYRALVTADGSTPGVHKEPKPKTKPLVPSMTGGPARPHIPFKAIKWPTSMSRSAARRGKDAPEKHRGGETPGRIIQRLSTTASSRALNPKQWHGYMERLGSAPPGSKPRGKLTAHTHARQRIGEGLSERAPVFPKERPPRASIPGDRPKGDTTGGSPMSEQWRGEGGQGVPTYGGQSPAGQTSGGQTSNGAKVTEREDLKVCPFCSDVATDLDAHFREHHKDKILIPAVDSVAKALGFLNDETTVGHDQQDVGGLFVEEQLDKPQDFSALKAVMKRVHIEGWDDDTDDGDDDDKKPSGGGGGIGGLGDMTEGAESGAGALRGLAAIAAGLDAEADKRPTRGNVVTSAADKDVDVPETAPIAVTPEGEEELQERKRKRGESDEGLDQLRTEQKGDEKSCDKCGRRYVEGVTSDLCPHTFLSRAPHNKGDWSGDVDSSPTAGLVNGGNINVSDTYDYPAWPKGSSGIYRKDPEHHLKKALDLLDVRKPGGGHRFTEREDRMAHHIAASERKRGKSAKRAESIGYATVNARKIFDAALAEMKKAAFDYDQFFGGHKYKEPSDAAPAKQPREPKPTIGGAAGSPYHRVGTVNEHRVAYGMKPVSVHQPRPRKTGITVGRLMEATMKPHERTTFEHLSPSMRRRAFSTKVGLARGTGESAPRAPTSKTPAWSAPREGGPTITTIGRGKRGKAPMVTRLAMGPAERAHAVTQAQLRSGKLRGSMPRAAPKWTAATRPRGRPRKIATMAKSVDKVIKRLEQMGRDAI